VHEQLAPMRLQKKNLRLDDTGELQVRPVHWEGQSSRGPPAKQQSTCWRQSVLVVDSRINLVEDGSCGRDARTE
jgi:hypothetical protein